MWRLFNWLSPKHTQQKSPAPSQSRLLNAGRITETKISAETRNALHGLEGHLFCWLLDVSPAQINQTSPNEALVLAELDRRLTKTVLEELPRQPAVLPALMGALSDRDVKRSHLAKIILGDPSLTDQLLHVANSPFFKPGEQQIESVEHAIFLLGIDGIRSVASAAALRPMMTARTSQEALFAQRVWRWGLSCARASELIANAQGTDANAYFLVGLLPSLAYITLRREVQRIYRAKLPEVTVEPSVIRKALRRYDWHTAQIIAEKWNLPPRYHAHLLAAERPSPRSEHTPLNDGIIMGTREVLRHAHQRNLSDEVLRQAIPLSERQFDEVRSALLLMLREGARNS
ncbi:HDOD domain-containing protein [Marinobacter sp. 1Y8]